MDKTNKMLNRNPAPAVYYFCCIKFSPLTMPCPFRFAPMHGGAIAHAT